MSIYTNREMAMLFDSSKCTACKGCQVACKQWNTLPSPLGLNEQKFTGSYQAPLNLNGDTRLLMTFDEKPGKDKMRPVEWPSVVAPATTALILVASLFVRPVLCKNRKTVLLPSTQKSASVVLIAKAPVRSMFRDIVSILRSISARCATNVSKTVRFLLVFRPVSPKP